MLLNISITTRALLLIALLFACKTTDNSSELQNSQNTPHITYICSSSSSGKQYTLITAGKISVAKNGAVVGNYDSLDVQTFPSDDAAGVMITEFVKPEGDVIATIKELGSTQIDLEFEIGNDKANCTRQAERTSSQNDKVVFSCKDGTRKFYIEKAGRDLNARFKDFSDFEKPYGSCVSLSSNGYRCDKKGAASREFADVLTSKDGKILVQFSLPGDDGVLYTIYCEKP